MAVFTTLPRGTSQDRVATWDMGANIYALFPEYAIPLTSLLQGIQMDPYGLFKIGESFLNGVSTTGGAQLLARGYEQVSLFFDHFRQYNDALFLGLLCMFHLSAL